MDYNILIYAPDIPNLWNRTKSVLQALRTAGGKLNEEKCEFEVQRVKYLGHILTSDGIEIDPEKVEAIARIKSPTCKKWFRTTAWYGSAQIYSKPFRCDP